MTTHQLDELAEAFIADGRHLPFTPAEKRRVRQFVTYLREQVGPDHGDDLRDYLTGAPA